MNQFLGILNIMKSFSSPQSFVQNLMQNQKIMNSPIGNAVTAASKGETKKLEEIARNMCKENGINPDDLASQIRQAIYQDK